MPELCDRCDYRRKSDGKCKIHSERDQQDYIDRGECNFAAVHGRAVSMTPKAYLFARKWYRKGDDKRIKVSR